MLNSLQNELTRLGVSCDAPAIIRSQNGVTVARVSNGGESCILKFFERPEFRREIEAYRLLGSLGVPTIRVLAHTDSALLLEDLSASPRWRLAEAGDMADCELAERLAEWYVCLHARGFGVTPYGEAPRQVGRPCTRGWRGLMPPHSRSHGHGRRTLCKR